MARPGVSPEQIIQVIEELSSERQDLTVTAIRERLGSGSYSTIGAVLGEWRREQARTPRPAIPPLPGNLLPLLTQLWTEAWKSAVAVAEPQRQAAARERGEWERSREEMTAEITRLEGEIQGLQREEEASQEACRRQGQELEAARLEHAKAVGTLAQLQAEVDRIRTESKQGMETLSLWIERATKAELKLQNAANVPSEPTGSRNRRTESPGKS